MKTGRFRRITDRASGDMALIAHGCVVDGNVNSDGDVMVLGEVRGDGRVAGTVTLAEGGVWKGDLSARNLIVAGTAEGSLSAMGRIEVCETARIAGTVTGGAIAVGQGAVIDGEIRTLDDAAATEFVERRDRDESAEAEAAG
ncbi:MAG: polymer-forming cytoskeletal protein [Pseudomonadota bacterium]